MDGRTPAIIFLPQTGDVPGISSEEEWLGAYMHNLRNRQLIESVPGNEGALLGSLLKIENGRLRHHLLRIGPEFAGKNHQGLAADIDIGRLCRAACAAAIDPFERIDASGIGDRSMEQARIFDHQERTREGSTDKERISLLQKRNDSAFPIGTIQLVEGLKHALEAIDHIAFGPQFPGRTDEEL